MTPDTRDFRRRKQPKEPAPPPKKRGTGPLAPKTDSGRQAFRRKPGGKGALSRQGSPGSAPSPESVARRIRRMEIRTDRLVRTILGGEYQSVFKGRGMTFDEVREYQEGDDTRAIDWNVTARMDRLFVKKFVEERELTVILAVDVSASQDFATAGEDLKRDLAAKFAMAIAMAAVANNDRVGLFLFTDSTEHFIPPRRGRTHGLRLVRDLLAYRPQGKRTDLAAAVGALARLLRKPATVFFCSDFLASDLDVLRRLTARHDLVAVTLSDRAEEELPEIGLVEFMDPETGQTAIVDTRDAQVQAAYRERAAARRRRRQAAFRAMGIDEVELFTHESYIRPLFGFFRRRGARRVRRRAR